VLAVPDFSFTEEQELFRKTVREFCEKEIEPRAREIDEKAEIPDVVIKGMAKLGLMGIMVSSEYGGSEADAVTAAIAAEEIARADISCATAVYYLVQAGWSYIFDKYGKPEWKEEILPKLTKGEAWVGIATTEPGGGSDLAGMKTTMKKVDGKWILNGEKAYISGVREALKYGGVHMTLVKTAPELGHRGMTFVALPIKGTKGIETSLFEDMGRMGISTGAFKMDNVEVDEKWIVGELNRGFYYAMEGFNVARVFVAAACVGAAEKALEIGMEYIKQRTAFGVPIAKYEGIQFNLADQATKLEAAKLLVYRAAWAVDQFYKGKMKVSDVNKYVAMAKLVAPLWAFDLIKDVMIWHGAYGYTKECPLEMGLRGVMSYCIGAEGAQNIMRIIIGRELLGREYMPYK